MLYELQGLSGEQIAEIVDCPVATVWSRLHYARREFKRLVETGDEVLVTYESTRNDGTRFRNTEVLTIPDGRISKAEVYFGWDL